MWLWKLSDLTIIGVAALISILMLVKLGFFPPIVLTAVYAFLSIQFDGASVKDFLNMPCGTLSQGNNTTNGG